MPTIPPYPDNLPRCLDPRSPRHALLLAYWVFFRPSLLLLYLYHADPELDRTKGRRFQRLWRILPYRNLFLLLPTTVLIISVLLGPATAVVVNTAQGEPTDWTRVAFGVAFGVALGVALAAALAVAGDGEFGVAAGVAYGVAAGVATGVTYGVASSGAYGVAAGLAFGLAFGVALAVVYGVAGGVAYGLAFGLAFGLAGGVAGGLAVGVAYGVATCIGSVRLPFYLLQLAQAGVWRKGIHPILWDELLVLPLPGAQRFLACRLETNEPDGLPLVAGVLGNPFQRWVAQRALQRYLHEQTTPLHTLNRLLTDPGSDIYVIPNRNSDWSGIPPARQLVLGEVAGRRVETNRPGERLIWFLTRPLRDRRVTPLTLFAGMLYQLLREQQNDEAIDLSRYRDAYTGLDEYPGGTEIVRSYEAMAAFLTYADLPALSAAAPVAAGLAGLAEPLRPKVLRALERLGAVGAEVATYEAATSRANRQAALLRAAALLEEVGEYVAAEVQAPERAILRQIVRRWRPLISEAGGKAGRGELAGPIPNPYTLNNPVLGDLFVGREDVMRDLEELWTHAGQVPSVVIYGHRRMGKSSILRNLGPRFGANTVVVDFNMQRVGQVASTGDLLYRLALALYDSLPEAAQAQIGEPAEERFLAHNPTTAFDRYLMQLAPARGERRFIVAVDEFEKIEEQIEKKLVEPYLLEYWRALIQTYPWFVMAFAGLHTLEEMSSNYWNPLFGSVNLIKVSFLTPGAARRLITQPSPDFAIDYDEEAIERIIALTNGQPFLVQLIGHMLVTWFNRQTFEEGVERERRFTLADVELVIDTPEFHRNGNAYFSGVWGQAERSAPPHQPAVLYALSHGDLSLTEIAEAAALPAEAVRDALATLIRHDVVEERDRKYGYTVELLRRWVAQRQDARSANPGTKNTDE